MSQFGVGERVRLLDRKSSDWTGADATTDDGKVVPPGTTGMVVAHVGLTYTVVAWETNDLAGEYSDVASLLLRRAKP